MFPYKLVLHLLSKALDAGVNLQTHTPVTAVSNVPDNEGYITLTTPRGIIRAAKTVYATNGYTSSILPEFVDKILPVRGICSHIKPGKGPRPRLPNSYIIRWSDTEYEYLVPRLDGSIVVGGARSMYYHDLQSWYNNVNDDQLIDSAKTHFDGYMQRVFHGWEDSQAYTSKVWTGSKATSPFPARNCKQRLIMDQLWATHQTDCRTLVPFQGDVINSYLPGSTDTACRRSFCLPKE
jgi:glycine/D-amino acid oxidase-like deaminating enzyme